MRLERIPGDGWLALLGGGEITFGDTEDADRAWLAKLNEDGEVGFVPAASGSTEYGGHFADYLAETFDRRGSTIPIYRRRDARRAKNAARIAESAAVYLGGGVVDYLLDALAGTPALDALAGKLEDGGTVVAIAAAAQALGQAARSLLERGQLMGGLAFLPGGVVEPNFDPGHDRRLRQMFEHPEVRWGLGIAAGSVVLIGPGGEAEVVGEAYYLKDSESDLEPLEARDPS